MGTGRGEDPVDALPAHPLFGAYEVGLALFLQPKNPSPGAPGDMVNSPVCIFYLDAAISPKPVWFPSPGSSPS